ncbi:MAG TPA: phosphate ABC transporter ATP-binding protein [Thermoplasmata archaeon]|nr:phosphate ABC transporter ATP-binding protein [Thermoplasmata archaeon]
MSAGAAESSPPVVSVQQLVVTAKKKQPILRGISLDFPARSLTAVVGPSGCGKTTFVRSLNRMVELTPGLKVEGVVNYLGQNIYDPRVNPVLVRRRIGMVFQRPTVFPMSVFENAAFGLRLIHEAEDEIDAAVEEALQRAGLWDEVRDDLNRPALALSGGQQQRLCIARALAVRPRVLLMDEPTSALDPAATQRVEATMQRLKEEIVIVLVTHNVGQAARVSDRTAFLHSGHLVELGPTADILERPRDPLTQQFITGRFE